ncbi:MAG TPA: IgGFc-binding protein, partial [Polyangiaceae bacterium]|nr:IgGFc-binding protein [Polyangiaceae bacterium]
LEYAPAGGPSGKDWSMCPGQSCNYPCLSYTNDASLLLPTTALTGNYRITAQSGWPNLGMGAYFAITGTQDNTTVTVKVSAKGNILKGDDIQATPGNGLLTFPLNKGEVVELASSGSADLGGSLVTASAPVQVITGVPCIQAPLGTQYCDHIEEAVSPAETLGQHYFVTVPTGPNGDSVGHIVRLYGNVDGTKLSYQGAKPANAPETINAGEVVDLGVVKGDFEITGSRELAVGSFMLGAELVDPLAAESDKRGDPSQSHATAVEQYRVKYVFLAPDDYTFSYVDVVQPLDATVLIDAQPITAEPTPISSNYGVARVKLGPGIKGAHVLTATAPVGIQVMGYGTATSYHYPGGLDLRVIAPPPPIPK